MIENFLWQINQASRQSYTAASSSAISSATSAARDAKQTSVDLTAQLDKLTLITKAMWELLQKKTGLTERDLISRVKEIDPRDGVEDGKVTRQISHCTKCDRVMSTRHTKCIYGGEEKLITPAFDEIT